MNGQRHLQEESMGPAWPEERGGWSQQEVSSVPYPCWDLPHAEQYHTGCLIIEVSLAVLHMLSTGRTAGRRKEVARRLLSYP